MLSDAILTAPSMDVFGSVHVAIVDDHDGYRRGLNDQLRELSACKVVLTATGGPDFMARLEAAQPVHIVLMDLQMPHMHGTEVIKWLREHHPDIRVLAISFETDDAKQLRAVRAGARGFLSKAMEVSDLERAFDHVLRTGYYYTDHLHALLLRYPGGITPEIQERRRLRALISERELEVMRLVARLDSPTSKKMAAELFLSRSTVDNHIKSVCDALGVPNRRAAVLKMKELGLFDKEEME